jgi:signal-transduction protein with cAMP-binding, CBS, and nucleotidyltransferase domain
MAEKHVGGIIVVEGGVLAGILTEQDIVRKVVAQGNDALKMKVEDIMETKLHKISPAQDVYDAIIKMGEVNIRHLPVVDEDEFMGLITMKDVLKIEPQLFDFIVSKFELKEETKKPVFGGDSKDGVCELCGKFTTEILSVGNSRVCEDCKSFV